MPEVDPAYYDAIDRVIEERKEQGEWAEDEMRSALMDLAKGVSQSEAAEERDFSQPLLSQRWSDVKDAVKDIKASREAGSSLFRDPLEEAIEEFEGFFDEMNEKYDMGIHDRAVQMMVDEIRDAGQLPAPMYVDQFLRGTKSGVTGADVDYIQRRYETWVQNFKQEGQNQQGVPGQVGGMGGANVQPRQENPGGMSGGVPVQHSDGGMPAMAGNQQPAPPHRRDGPQGGGQSQPSGPPSDPRVESLQQQVEQLTETVQQMAEDDDDEQMVTVTQENGNEVTMSLDQAMAMGLVGDGNDEPDFIEKLAQAKEAGLIPDESDIQQDEGRSLEETVSLLDDMGVLGDDSGEDMADAIGQAIQHLGEKQMQAQQQMSQNFSSVLEQIKDMQTTEEEDLTADDVQQIINETLKEDEVDRLENQINNMRSEFKRELRDQRQGPQVGVEDPEYLKTDRKMQFREKQLDSINENLRELPKEVGMTVREALVPAMKELTHGEGGAGHPLWSPPDGAAGGQPGFTPQTVPETTTPERKPKKPQPSGRSERGYPEPDTQPEPEPEPAEPQQGMGQQQPTPSAEEKGREVREKLGLEGDDDDNKVEA